MIAELINLLLSMLIRLTPLVRTNAIKLSRSSGNESQKFACWIPLVGWVAVSVKRLAPGDRLPMRVVAVHWPDGLLTRARTEPMFQRTQHRLFGNQAIVSSGLSRRTELGDIAHDAETGDC